MVILDINIDISSLLTMNKFSAFTSALKMFVFLSRRFQAMLSKKFFTVEMCSGSLCIMKTIHWRLGCLLSIMKRDLTEF